MGAWSGEGRRGEDEGGEEGGEEGVSFEFDLSLKSEGERDMTDYLQLCRSLGLWSREHERSQRRKDGR